LRFILDFSYATGLRASELVGATLGAIEKDSRGDYWLHVMGKGQKIGKVALPPMAKLSLEQYLVARGLPTTPRYWKADAPLIGSLQKNQPNASDNKSAGKDQSKHTAGITSARLRKLLERFFETVATTIEKEQPALAGKVRLATPHWMRHTHATHSLAKGVELTTVRDNLRHASIATTSIYLHGDDIKRAKQMREAFRT
jgi:site-specific recombinase XerD